MRNRLGALLTGVLLASSVTFAQQGQPQLKTIPDSINFIWKDIEKDFTDLAEAMPEDRWSFKPTQGEFKDVRTFGEQVKHVACANEAWAKQMIADPSHFSKRAGRFARVLEKRPPKSRSGPRFGDNLRANMRTDFGFIKLDDAIERGGFDVSLLDQDRLERAHPQLHLGKIGALIMIMIMCSHGRNIADETGGVH